MLLAEELALVAIDPDSGRHPLGIRERGPKITSILSHMDRGLRQRLDTGTWDSIVDGLVRAGTLAPTAGTFRRRNDVRDRSGRERLVERLRAAAAGHGALDVRTAVLLSMTGPANLLEVVAPERSERKHARRRIDHALDTDQLEPIGEMVRQVLADAAAVVAATAATTAAITASS